MLVSDHSKEKKE